MEIQNEKEAFERFKAKQTGMDYETLKKDLDDCEKRFPNNRYAGWNFKSDWELWQAAKAQAVPEGFVLVPKEPTDIEIESIKEKHWDMRGCQLCKSDYIDLYKAMIEAQEPAND